MIQRANLLKSCLGLVIIGVLLKSIIGLQALRLDQAKTINETIDEKLAQVELNNVSTLKRLPTFGFNNIAADWTFLQFIQYFGDEPVREALGYRLVPEYFDAIVRHDPRFVSAFLVLSPASSIFAGTPERTVQALAKAVQSLHAEKAPQGAYYLWFYKGIDEMLFLGAIPEAQRSYETAAQWARIENTPESLFVAANAVQTSQFLANNPDSRHARIGAWVNIMGSSTDRRVQAEAKQQIEKLGGKFTVVEKNGTRSIQVSVPKTD
jgi:hypothetical protein